MNWDAYKTTVPYAKFDKNPEAFQLWIDDVVQKESKFKADLFDELGILNHPKRELLFDKAYKLGHANGFNEVFNYALDLVELIED